MKNIYNRVGEDPFFENGKNILDGEEKIVFFLSFLGAYLTHLTEEEIKSFPHPTQKILFVCLFIATVSPIPGGTLAISLPLGAITWKYRDKIWDIINIQVAKFYN